MKIYYLFALSEQIFCIFAFELEIKRAKTINITHYEYERVRLSRTDLR